MTYTHHPSTATAAASGSSIIMARTSTSAALAVLGASLLVALLEPQHAEAAVHRMKLHKRSDEEFVNAKLARAEDHVIHPDHQGAADEPM